MSDKRVALVTGAAQGLGSAIALRLARDGYDVAVTRLHREELAAIVQQITALGVRALPLGLDLRSQDSIEHVIQETADKLGRIDVLVNNAGVTLRRDALDVTRTEWQEVIDVNL